MKELHGAASASVTAPADDCYALIEALEGYPSWYPEAVRRVEVVERSADGRPSQARAQLHLSYGPVARDFNLLLAVACEPRQSVRLTRVPHGPSDREHFQVMWRIEPGRIDVTLVADLSVPRLVPVGGIGASMAQGFVGAAARELANRSR